MLLFWPWIRRLTGREMADAVPNLQSLSFINGKLLRRFLQLDGDLDIWLVYGNVFSMSLEAGRNHLDTHLAVRNASRFGFTVIMGLKFQPILPLLAVVVNKVEHHLSVFDRLAIRVPYDCHVHFSHLLCGSSFFLSS